MKVRLADAALLLREALTAAGLSPADAATATGHLMDCELRGLGYGGLARALTVCERLRVTGLPSSPIRIERESASTVTIDGADHLGYVVAQRATDLAIGKARETGIGVAAAHTTWYTGMFSYYLEAVTRAGMVGMAAGNAGATVAPHGATEGLIGTNPIAFGFPGAGDDDAVIWDSGTSAVTHAEVVLAGRTGQDLPEGVAYAADGTPTRSPADALAGALAVWGGHRGSGLALTVHLLGMMTGAPALPTAPVPADLGFLLWVVDPGVLTDATAFRSAVSDHAARVRAARPVDPDHPVRVPFDGSRRRRRATQASGVIDVAPEVVAGLRAIVASGLTL